MDIYTKLASEAFNVPEGEVTPEQRMNTKIANFFSNYGSYFSEPLDEETKGKLKKAFDEIVSKGIDEGLLEEE